MLVLQNGTRDFKNRAYLDAFKAHSLVTRVCRFKDSHARHYSTVGLLKGIR